MANCSFIKATDARNRARNDTLIWGEICAIQEAILAAIDGDPCATPPVPGSYSTIVANGSVFTDTDAITSATLATNGTGYSVISATATIDANGTSGTGATVTPTISSSGAITSFTVTNGGDLALQSATIGTAGTRYSIGDVLTLSGGTFTTAAQVTVSAVATIASQDETAYDGAGNNGSFTGGTGYAVSDTITLTDGSLITVDQIDGGGAGPGVVTQFTVTTNSTAPGIDTENELLNQAVSSAAGTGFTLTLGDNNQQVQAVTVSVGGEYTVAPSNPVSVTGGTGGTGAGGVDLTLVGIFAVGYTPVSVTATLQNGSDLTNAQTHLNYNNAGNNGTFTPGADYMVDEEITLTENSVITVDAVTPTNYVIRAGEDETSYTNGLPAVGAFSAGANYAALDTITLSDGSLITVDAAPGGAVTEFTVTTSSTLSVTASGATRTQLSTSGSGTGFSLTPGTTTNEIPVGPITEFTVASTGVTQFFLGQTLAISSTTTSGVGALPVGQQSVSSGFTLKPGTNNAVTITHGGSTAVLTPYDVDGVITDVVVNNIGSGYVAGQPILFSHPNGTGATAAVGSVNGTGGITGIVIINGGSGYETANPLVTITHPNGQGFEGTVQVTNGAVSGISIQNGGLLYNDVYPYIVVNDVTGTGAQINVTGVSGGAITSIQLADGGSGYSDGDTAGTTNASVLIYNSDGNQNGTATITLAKDVTSFNGVDSTDYYSVLSGQATDAVIADQIQYVLDYFTALGYNIRAQVNPSTGNTLQWQIIW